MIEFCLHTHKLTRSDLRYGITASGHVAGEDVRRAIDMMDVSWVGLEPHADTMDSDARREQEQRIRKRAVNSMVGVWGLTAEQASLKSSLSYRTDDSARGNGFESLASTNAYGVQGLISTTTAPNVFDPGSYSPLYDLCVCTEHVRLAQTYQCTRAVYKIQRRFTLQVR